MILTALDITIIIVFLLITLFIGVYFKKRASGGLTDFFLGGRNLPWLVAGLSMVATTFAADTPLAVSEMVAQNGVSKNWLWWSFLAGGMLTVFFFARLWRRAGIVTELEFIDIRYAGKAAKFLRGFKSIYLGLFMNSMIIGWVNLAFISILTEFFGVEESVVLWVVFGSMAFAAAYSTLSGLLGVAVTDTLQFVVAMVGTAILAYLVLDSPQVGGMSNLRATLPADYFEMFPRVGRAGIDVQSLSLTVGAFLSFVAVQWWAGWYPGAEPGGGGYIAQRMMSTRNERDAQKATLLFQVLHYCVRPWPWILVGLAAVLLYNPQYSLSADTAAQIETLMQSGKTEAEVLQALPLEVREEAAQAVAYSFRPQLGYVFAMKDFLPNGLRGLLLTAFLAAYLSTISTQLNMGAGFLVNDLYLPFQKSRGSEPTPKKQVFAGRFATLLIMLAAVGITAIIDSISGVWEFIIEAGAGLGTVLILRWYWWRINAWSEIAAMLAPFVGLLLSYWARDYVSESFIQNRGFFLLNVLMTTAVWLVVTYLTRPEPIEKLKSFCERVRPEGFWGNLQTTEQRGKNRTSFQWRLWCWVSAVLFAYAVLFASGGFLMQHENWLAYVLAALGGLVGLVYGMRKLDRLDEPL